MWPKSYNGPATCFFVHDVISVEEPFEDFSVASHFKGLNSSVIVSV